ncbi:MAG: hypothetical protein AABZ47_03700 [Planctomycetota bacterium]
MSIQSDSQLLEKADHGLKGFLTAQREAGRITGSYYEEAVARTLPNLKKWLLAAELDELSPNLRTALRDAIRDQQWEALTNAFSRDVSFGTGGIREKMGPNRNVVLKLKEMGIHAPIIKGPNTINDVTLLLTSAGAARFGQSRTPPFSRVVIGFDSRVRGIDFAREIAKLFLAYDYTVFLFDEACLYPSVTYAVPTLKADIGIFISASHNDFRYNGFKLSCQNGSQFDPAERNVLYRDFILTTQFRDMKRMAFSEARDDQLWFLGGMASPARKVIHDGPLRGLPLAEPLPDVGKDVYAGREHRIIDMHTMHTNHVKGFLLRREMITAAKKPLSIGYSAFNGSGRKAVPRLLTEIGFRDVKRITRLDALDGMFPAFCSDPGKEQQPDPGDWRAADIAVNAFKEEYGKAWDGVDLILGTDPDADRCGVIGRVPPRHRPAYPHPGTGELRDYSLLSADEVWSLILWYRLSYEVEKFGKVVDADRKFITLSHTTTDLLTRVACKFGLGVLKTWVGFAQLAAGTRAIWDLHEDKDTEGLTEGGRLPQYHEGCLHRGESVVNRTIHSWIAMNDRRRSINVAALEQSNGFSALGGPPPDDRSLGQGGHVRDKDGTFAALLVAELVQWAKENGTNLFDLMDEKLYLDPDIGLYITYYEPDPIDGEYEGLAGYTKKRRLLDQAEALFATSQEKSVQIGGLATQGAVAYRTGKYDAINWPGFPDEGYRFFFDDEHESHLTIRPSGTSNALRFHVQLRGGYPKQDGLVQKKADLRATCVRIVSDIRSQIGATR